MMRLKGRNEERRKKGLTCINYNPRTWLYELIMQVNGKKTRFGTFTTLESAQEYRDAIRRLYKMKELPR